MEEISHKVRVHYGIDPDGEEQGEQKTQSDTQSLSPSGEAEAFRMEEESTDNE